MFKARMETFKTPHFSAHLLPLSLLPLSSCPFWTHKKEGQQRCEKRVGGQGGLVCIQSWARGGCRDWPMKKWGEKKAREAGVWIQIR